MALERGELLVPLCLDLVEPCPHGGHRPGLEPEPPGPRVLRRALVDDDPDVHEDPQMPAHGRRRGVGRGRELTRSARTGAQLLDHPTAGGVGQRGEELVDLQRGRLHTVNSSHIRELLSTPTSEPTAQTEARRSRIVWLTRARAYSYTAAPTFVPARKMSASVESNASLKSAVPNAPP